MLLKFLVPAIVLLLAVAGQAVAVRNAYAAMMYMGTPRDYEFYVATRVMMKSLTQLNAAADLVVIASADVPASWCRALEEEDGVKVVTVENINNPYSKQGRFKLTLNKLYAWNLLDYDRVVMLDSDNLFLQNTDELFQCGEFCAVFINPCIFHTGLFVLQPSATVFKDMLHQLAIGRRNPDGADQGFIGSYFPDLLDRPMFYPPPNATKLVGTYRLPLGYQMDASYFYLKLRWSIPCGPNSVITFPSASWMKPWYWWSWPALPLGLSWHEQRRQTLGYSTEMPVALMQSLIYLGLIAMVRLTSTNVSKLFYRRLDKYLSMTETSFRFIVIWSMIVAYITPFFVIPTTIHPLVGWSLYLLGSFTLSSIVGTGLQLPMLAVLTPWFGIIGALLAMTFPWYSNGVVRALAVGFYAFCCAPFLWVSLVKVMASIRVSSEREALFLKLGEAQPAEFIKLC